MIPKQVWSYDIIRNKYKASNTSHYDRQRWVSRREIDCGSKVLPRTAGNRYRTPNYVQLAAAIDFFNFFSSFFQNVLKSTLNETNCTYNGGTYYIYKN